METPTRHHWESDAARSDDVCACASSSCHWFNPSIAHQCLCSSDGVLRLRPPSRELFVNSSASGPSRRRSPTDDHRKWRQCERDAYRRRGFASCDVRKALACKQFRSFYRRSARIPNVRDSPVSTLAHTLNNRNHPRLASGNRDRLTGRPGRCRVALGSGRRARPRPRQNARGRSRCRARPDARAWPLERSARRTLPAS
jgi:hypothetical protein